MTTTAAGVLVRSDLGSFQLSGADIGVFLQAVLPLLDGTYTAEQIADKLPDYSSPSILQLIDLLRARGVVRDVEASTLPEQGQAEFFNAWSLDPNTAAQRLAEASVLLVGLEPWGVTTCVNLAAAGVGAIHLLDDDVAAGPEDLRGNAIWGVGSIGSGRAQTLAALIHERYPSCKATAGVLRLKPDTQLDVETANATFIIAALRADELLVLSAIARFAHAHGIPSLYGTMEDLSVIAGPLVIPGQTPCWNCTRLRLLANASHPEETHALQSALLEQRPASRVHSYLAPMAPLLGQLLAIEAVKYITRYTALSLTGHQILQNLISLETTRHAILRMPWCDVCGGAAAVCAPLGGPASDKGSIALEDIREPEQLRDELKGVVDERTGIVSRVAVHPAGTDDPEVPVTCSALLCSFTEGHFHEKSQEIGSGKALSTVRAMIGAVGEAVERYSAARYRKRNLLRAAIRDLDDGYVDPRSLSLYTQEQYDDPAFPFRAFDPEQPIEWVRGRWLNSEEPVWLPALPVYFNFHVPPPERFCQVSSNGLAAGSGYEDAAWRATFELIERDTFMLTWLSRKAGRRIVLDGDLDAGTREVVRQLKRTGARIEVYALDVGVGIPVAACIGWGDGTAWPGATVALAAHGCWHAAVKKAILEQGHVGPYIRRLSRENGSKVPANAEDVHALIDHALFYADPERAHELEFLGRAGDVAFKDLVRQQELSNDACLERFHKAGLRIAIADVTSPDLNTTRFRVARALGAYVQPIDFGYGMRRLGNPRLHALLQGREPNAAPHPIA